MRAEKSSLAASKQPPAVCEHPLLALVDEISNERNFMMPQ
jgi:hypothetical protein